MPLKLDCYNCRFNAEHKALDEPCNTCISEHQEGMPHGIKWEPKYDVVDRREKVGMKHDSGKPPLSRVPRVLLDEVAKVLEFGAEKYEWDNWRNGISYHRVGSAAMRHLTAFMDCETMDSESSLQHLSHAACCIAFLLEYEKYPERFKEFDDRFYYLRESLVR